MNGETINLNNSALVRSLGSQDAEAVKEVNFSNEYYWMINRWGRRVPIALTLEKDALRRGFIHTDRVVQSDDLSQRVSAPLPVTPMEVMAKLAEKMVQSNETTKEALVTVSDEVKKSRKKKVTVEEDTTEVK